MKYLKVTAAKKRVKHFVFSNASSESVSINQFMIIIYFLKLFFTVTVIKKNGLYPHINIVHFY